MIIFIDFIYFPLIIKNNLVIIIKNNLLKINFKSFLNEYMSIKFRIR